MPTHKELRCGADDAGRKIDRVLRKAMPGLSLSLIYKFLRKGAVKVNGKRVDRDYRVAQGDLIRSPSDDEEGYPAPRSSPGSKIDPPEILFEGEEIIALNKGRGMLSHGEGGADAFILDYLKDRLEASLSFRPAPLHRLDRNTTGILLCSRSLLGAKTVSALLAEGRIRKRYIALVRGEFRGKESWKDRLEREDTDRTTKIGREGSADGQEAETLVESLYAARGNSLVSMMPLTGRTHQLRVQSAHRGFPLEGDSKYGGGLGGYLLHAEALALPEPEAGILGTGLIRAPLFAGQISMIEKYLGLSAEELGSLLESSLPSVPPEE